MKCPFCLDYSLTYNAMCDQYTCHTYNANIQSGAHAP